MKKVILIRSRAIDSTIYKIVDSLVINGYDVHILVWDRQHHLKDNDKKNYTIHKFNLKAPYDKMSLFFYLPFWFLYEFYFLLTNRSDYVHACDLDTLWPAVILKPFKRAKFCYIIYDFYAKNFCNNGSIINKFLIAMATLAEKSGASFADVLFLVDESRIAEVEGVRIKKVVYLYNSPRDSLSDASPTQPDSCTLTIFYAGILDHARGVEYMVKAVEMLDNVRLIIAGPNDLSHLSIPLSDNIKKKVGYIGFIPSYDGVLEKTMSSDVLFRFIDPASPKCTFESPNKLFEAMMAGKPIIVNEEMGASQIVVKEDCGITVPYGDVEAITRVLIRLRDDPDLRRRLGSNGRRAFHETYSWEIMEKRLLEAYRNM